MNVISFSLYGRDLKYQLGMIENAIAIQELFPNWKTRVYCNSEIVTSTIEMLEELKCDVFLQERYWHRNGMFWRYLPIGEVGIDYLIFRDADSRLSQRDVMAVEKWIESGKPAHIIRDHPFHHTPILGGLWGIDNRKVRIEEFWELAKGYSETFGEDQRFLTNHVYSSLKRNSLIHDRFFAFESRKNKIILPGIGGEYMGESYTENGEFKMELRDEIRRVSASRFLRNKLRLSSFFKTKLLFCQSYFISQRSLTVPKRH